MSAQGVPFASLQSLSPLLSLVTPQHKAHEASTRFEFQQKIMDDFDGMYLYLLYMNTEK